MREVELKSVVRDLDAARAALQVAGAVCVYAGRLEDLRYDTPERTLALKDHVLRLRIYLTNVGEWPGVRDELLAFFDGRVPPSTVLGISALVEPSMLVEIDAEARA